MGDVNGLLLCNNFSQRIVKAVDLQCVALEEVQDEVVDIGTRHLLKVVDQSIHLSVVSMNARSEFIEKALDERAHHRNEVLFADNGSIDIRRSRQRRRR